MAEVPHELVGEFIDAVVTDSAKAGVLLAQHPALLNARWIHDETVLHLLALEDFEDGVRFLVADGADVNAGNEFGDSPLVDVAELGRNTIAKILLMAGAHPNGPSTPYRECPLHNAARKGNISLGETIAECGGGSHVRQQLR